MNKKIKFALPIITATAFLLGVAFLKPVSATTCSSTADCQRQIDSTRSSRYNQQLISGEYSTNINDIKSSIASLEKDLAETAAELKQTNNELARIKARIAYEREIIAGLINEVNSQDQVSGIEVLASSENFVDFFNRADDLRQVQKQLSAALNTLKELKTTALEKQSELSSLLKKQKSQRAGLNEKLGIKSQLLEMTQAEIQRLTSHLSALQRKQAYLIAQQEIGRSHYGGTGGYPWTRKSMYACCDPWGMTYRQCTSYAAWRWAADGHPIPYNWNATRSPQDQNAKAWGRLAERAGYKVDRYKNPRRGDIAVYEGGTYGHVMIVESVGKGSVTVSQYNADWTGRYSISSWKTSSLVFIHPR